MTQALLLDTRVVLWWLSGSKHLPLATKTLIEGSSAAHVSAATTWEVAIKRSIGKLELELPPGNSFPAVCAQYGFTLTDVSHDDAEAVNDLPAGRHDPFDRLIAATARRRGWAVVTRDRHFDDLAVRTVWQSDS